MHISNEFVVLLTSDIGIMKRGDNTKFTQRKELHPIVSNGRDIKTHFT
jgi:hypothetical protein